MSVRSRMKHRAAVQRQASTGEDPFGGPTLSTDEVYGGAPDVLHWGNAPLAWGNSQLEWGGGTDTLLHCYLQPRIERTSARDGTFFATATFLLLAPIGADLQKEDRIPEVTNRRGIVLNEDGLRVVVLLRRENHLEALLESYT